jgi:ATP-dependent protease ClpP protease subunit
MWILKRSAFSYRQSMLKYKMGVRRFIILISSQGGDVLSGVMAYNCLKGPQIDLTTVNVGNVDSSAGIRYCAGTKRYSVPGARFLIHEVSLTIQANGPGNMSIGLPSLEAQISMLTSQESTIAKILATAANKPLAEAEKRIHAQAALSAQEAKDWGLVQDIGTQLFDPNDSNLVLAVPQPAVISPQPSPTMPTLPQFSYSGAKQITN